MIKKGLGKGLSALVPDSYIAKQVQTSATAVLDVEKKEDTTNGGILEMDINAVMPNKSQPRTFFSESAIDELAASIKEKGIIQPLVVAKRGNEYEIICGERRYRAAIKAGLATVPVIVKDVAGFDVLEMALIENIQREDLSPIEEARAYMRLQEQGGYTHELIAQKVGKDRATVTNAIRLLKLPADIIDLVLSKKLSEGHARALLALEHEDQMRIIADRVIKEGLSVRALERLIQENPFKKRKLKEARRIDAEIVHLETLIQQRLSAKVRIVAGKKNAGRLEVFYKSLDEFDRLLDLMGVYKK